MTERRRKQSTQTPKENEVKSTISRKELISQIIKRKTKEKFLSESQRKYYDILTKNQITICSGPAGVGKSYISMKAAIDLLSDPSTPYEKIIIVRPAVEAEEKLGSLPGNVEEKLVAICLSNSTDEIFGKSDMKQVPALLTNTSTPP